MSHHRLSIGLDLLRERAFDIAQGKRVALLGNPAAVDSNFVHLQDLAMQHELNLVKLFGPEHGLLGDAQDMDHVGASKDRKTGVEVVSLYGATYDTLHMNPEDLDGVDVLICDLQDIGSRYYTFAYTIAFAMRACAKTNTKCVVLDRPNPIGGVLVEGNRTGADYKSFVGEYALPNRTGMTMGEVCQFFKSKDGLDDLDLEIVWMKDYDPKLYIDETTAPWVMPSPNMPTPDVAVVYPGACLFEGTNMSEGRGTTRPFELIGAPFIDAPEKLIEEAMKTDLHGVTFRPCFFKPTFQKHAGVLCGGLQMHTSIALLCAAAKFEGFGWREKVYEYVSDRLAIDLLFGSPVPRQMIEKDASAQEVIDFLDTERDDMLKEREDFLHYKR